MNPDWMYSVYTDRAGAASSPAARTVYMLGMMCAAAVRQRGIFAFVGEGYGGDWPNPREADSIEPATHRS